MDTLIGAENTWGLWAVTVAWVAVSIGLEQRYRWVAKVSGPILVMLGAVVLANLRVIPTSSPVYDTIWHYVVPVSIPLLLFRANIVAIVRESGPLFLVFHFSALGTVVGAVVATFALRGELEHSAEMAGIMTGSYTGGSVNFAALKATFDPEKRWVAVINSLMVADNLIMAIVFFACYYLVSVPFFRRLYRTPYEHAVQHESGTGVEGGMHAASYWRPKPISLLNIATALAVATSIAALAHLLAGFFERSSLPDQLKLFLAQPYLLITTVCVVAATAFRRSLERVAGAEELGMYLLYLFFFVIGAPADVVTILRDVPLLFAFCGIMAAFNLGVTLLLGWIFRRNLEEVALACNATLGGAPSAAAMAIAKGWRPLVLPAILVGVWGYVVGTYLGFTVGRLLLEAAGTS